MQNHIRYYKSLRAFTLIELLVVVSIIALLLSIMMPALGRARDSAKQIVCLSHMRQVGLALTLYTQENNNYVVKGRFHNNGDWLSLNSFYSNLTPYLDPSKKANNQVWDMIKDEAEQYNQIWEDLICPAVKKSEISTATFFQGISIRSLGINIAVGTLAHNGYSDGYGLEDWATGNTRKITDIKNSSGMIAFCDTLNTEYIYSGGYHHIESAGYDPDKYLPVRHPGGYGATFVDGHGDMVKAEVIREEPYNDIWRIR